MITSITSASTALDKHSLQRNFGLDLARAIAISLVLASHFSHNSLDSLGFWGVELFFALSGFLIGQILWRNFLQAGHWAGSQITNFWYRRWWRTLPNYYLFLFITLVSAIVNKEEIASLFGLFKFFWFGQFLLDRYNWGFYSVSWSLCIEEWFYLLFPLSLFIFNTFVKRRNVSFILSLLFIFISSAIVRGVLLHQDSEQYLRGITLARLDAIGYGVLVAYLLSVCRVSIGLKYIAFLLGALLQIYSIFTVFTLGLAYVVKSQVFLILVPLGFALMIPLLSLVPTPSKNLSFVSVAIERLSLWSYSIYLAHAPIMWFAYSLLSKYRDTFFGNLFSKIVAIIFTLVVSAFLYHYFEVPFTKRRPKEIRN